MLLRQPTEKARGFSDLCCPLTTAEVTACIYHYTDICSVVAQRTPLIDFIYFATKKLPRNNHILLPTLGYNEAKTWEQSLYYLLLRDFWRCPCPLSKVNVTKNSRDAGAHSRKHQLGSSESVSTFPKACRFTYLPRLQRPQLSMQKAWRHLVPASPALAHVYKHSTTTNLCEPHLQLPATKGGFLASENPS